METFEAGRLRSVHAGPVLVETGTSTVVLRSVEHYPLGMCVVWTCSPGPARATALAQGAPKVELALADGDERQYPSLGSSTSGAGRTLFGASYFAARGDPPPWLEVTVTVSGTTGAEVGVSGRVRFPLG